VYEGYIVILLSELYKFIHYITSLYSNLHLYIFIYHTLYVPIIKGTHQLPLLISFF